MKREFLIAISLFIFFSIYAQSYNRIGKEDAWDIVKHLICDPTIYSLAYIPVGSTVTWSLTPASNSVNTQNYYQLQADAPNANQCTVSRTQSAFYEGTLTATVTYDSVSLATLSKTVYGHTASPYLTGQYLDSNGNIDGYFNVYLGPYLTYVQPNRLIRILSPNYRGMSCIVQNSLYSAGSCDGYVYAYFYFTMYNDYCNMYFTSEGGCNDFSLFLRTGTRALLGINSTDNTCEISLNLPDVESDALYSSNNGSSMWEVEIVNAITGRTIIKEKVEGCTYRTDTSKWSAGVYIVRATIGNEVVTEKFSINR